MNTEIKAKNSHIKSMKLNVPYDGAIDIDANGIAFVSEKAAKALVNGTNDWEYVKKENPIDEDEKSNNKSEKSEEEQVVSEIKQMQLEGMIQMAKEMNYPEKEWSRFAKKEKLMAAYLIKKYNEAKLAEEDENVE